jgi:CSLREA domain-containing protein
LKSPQLQTSCSIVTVPKDCTILIESINATGGEVKMRILLATSLFVACLMLFGKSLSSAGSDPSKLRTSNQATQPKRTVARIPVNGRPYLNLEGLNLEGGTELPSMFSGDSGSKTLSQHTGLEARSMTYGDFDEDGVPDLICGYGGGGGGLVTVYRNIDSINAQTPDASRRKSDGTFSDDPFLIAGSFELTTPPDFVGSGDFDGDGHWDILAASRQSKELHLLPGDGRGGFLNERSFELPGLVTALATGEVNRADGLVDIVVGVDSGVSSMLLVFEGPEGALNASPESFPLPSKATSIALGQFDNDYPMDFAVAAGSELILVHGRDRKLSLDDIRKNAVPSASVDRRSFNFDLQSIVAGDFRAANEISIALLDDEGTVSLINPKVDINSVKPAKKKRKDTVESLGRWPGAAQVLCARVSTGPADDLIILNKDEHSLHILKTGISSVARSNLSSAVRVDVKVELEGEPLATLATRLNEDALNDLVVLQTGSNAPAILKTMVSQTFTVNTSDDHNDGICDTADCTLREAINAANANAGADTIAFNIPGAGAHTISPTSSLPTITDPVTIDGYTQPGATPNTLVNGDNAVLRIELDGSLAGFLGNGLTLTGGSSVVRGLAINRFKRIAFGVGSGININTNGNNLIEGNFLGTDITGTTGLSNNGGGVDIVATGGNRVGSTIPASRNLISGNVTIGGVSLRSATAVVQGNFIGTDISGIRAIGNNIGVVIVSGVTGSTIGGSVAGARNIISGNGDGIAISNSAGSIIQSNLIGTAVDGTTALPNLIDIDLGSTSVGNTIGGTTAGLGNVISAAEISGITHTSSAATLIQGNLIGTSVTGTPLGNTFAGVGGGNGIDCVIGGAIAGAGNIISFNGGSGALISGGSWLIMNNIVSFNGDDGVEVRSGKVTILTNSIFRNAGLGINLLSSVFFNDGVTPNDPCDADSSSANNLQNFPIITSAISTGVNISIQGMLDSAPGTQFRMDFYSNTECDPSGFGEGQTFIGSSTVTTASNCKAGFSVSFPIAVPAGSFITATASDPPGNTSEFSQCVMVQPPPFDLCLQDETNGNILQVNSSTGIYQFTNCRGTSLSGMGTITRKGCLITLQVDGPDRRILARIDTCANNGTATIQVLTQGTFSILDRNTSNNTCVCPGSQ